MTNLITLSKLKLTYERTNFLLAIVLSGSPRQSDIYLTYLALAKKSEALLEFNQLNDELQTLQLVDDFQDDNDYLYLTSEGLSFAILACQYEYHRIHRLLGSVSKKIDATYARFIFFGLHHRQYVRSAIDDKLLNESIIDGFNLLSETHLLWHLVDKREVVVGYGDYFFFSWLSLISSATSEQKFQTLNSTLSRDVKSQLPVHVVADLPLFSDKPQVANHFLNKLDISYLNYREEVFAINNNVRLSFSRLIDLFIVQNIQPQLVETIISQYRELKSVQDYPLGFSWWNKELDYLLIDDVELIEMFYDADSWISSFLIGEKVKWGQLVLELLQMCRVKEREELYYFFSDLSSHSLTHHVLEITPKFNLMRLAQNLLKHLMNLEPLIYKPDTWGLWLHDVESLLTTEELIGDERFVWVISEDKKTVSAKIQKKGKRGWSQGRNASLERYLYEYSELLELSESDMALISHFEYASCHWGNNYPLSKESLKLLVHASNIVNSNGDIISIVPEPSLLVIGEKKGLLKLERFPKNTKYTKVELLKERTANVYTFDATPDHVNRFFSLSKKIPPVPAGHVESLIPLLGNEVDWYSTTEKKGNITLGVWDENPHLWLNLLDGNLEISIEHQSKDGSIRICSGHGETWVYNGDKQWLLRDLKNEKKQAKILADSIGLASNTLGPIIVNPSNISEVLDAISNMKDIHIHWNANSKKVQTLTPKNIDLNIKQKGDWFNVSGDATIDGGLVLDLQRLLESRRTGYIDIKDQNLTIMVNDALRKQLSLLDSVLNDDLEVNCKMAYPLQKLIESMSVNSDNEWRELERKWSKSIPIKSETLEPLRDYQRTSVQWAIHLLTHGFGACLADDMGLGKTLQALMVIEHFAYEGPSLVVCPKSVSLNWLQESARFTPKLTILDLEACKDRVKTLAAAKSGEVILISYGLVTRIEKELNEISWQSIILDEAQQIKNPNAQRTKVLVNLNAKHRMTLSGTPVENNLVELWSQFSFLNSGLLGSLKQFKNKYGQASKNEDDMLRLRALVSPFIMRRMKKEVLTELPDKTEVVHYVTLNSKERSAYEVVRQDSLQLAKSINQGNSITLFSALTRLRQVCCDPHLVFNNMPETSSKLKDALNLVQEALEGGHKILIFSQFVQFLKRFSSLLEEQSITYSYLDGQSSTKMRRTNIDDFKSGKNDLFLISLKAGGTGLNLTEADTVIHLDPWWNPAVEDQASDRAHRMGQTKPVTIYRLVAINTVEDKIIRLHEDKRDLADKVLSGQSETNQINPEILLELLVE